MPEHDEVKRRLCKRCGHHTKRHPDGGPCERASCSCAGFMRWPSVEDAFHDLFGGEIIHTYTRAQALGDGVLIDVSDTAKEAGFKIPVAVTQGVWADCVAWSDEDQKKTHQDESGRLWDVLFMTHVAAARSRDTDRVKVQLVRVPREGDRVEPELVTLVAVIGPGDTADPVITIMQPGED